MPLYPYPKDLDIKKQSIVRIAFNSQAVRA
jgi:hypothetical protein